MVAEMTLFEKVKANLILEHDKDDELLSSYIAAAISYAESYHPQHISPPWDLPASAWRHS
jgi:hypothetical protein